MKIDKNMTIADLLQTDPSIAAILMREGLQCVACPASLNESLEDAARVHGISDADMDAIVDRINDFLSVM